MLPSIIEKQLPSGVPNWMKKRVDAGYANFYPRMDGSNDLSQPSMFLEAQHKFGPYQEMLDMQELSKANYKLNNNL